MKIENPQQYIGKKYGNITILKYYGKYRDGSCLFYCKCNCGKEFKSKMIKQDQFRTTCYACNIRKNIDFPIIDYYGQKYSIKDLAKKLNINYHTLCSRIYNLKWNIDRWAEPVKRRINET